MVVLSSVLVYAWIQHIIKKYLSKVSRSLGKPVIEDGQDSSGVVLRRVLWSPETSSSASLPALVSPWAIRGSPTSGARGLVGLARCIRRTCCCLVHLWSLAFQVSKILLKDIFKLYVESTHKLRGCLEPPREVVKFFELLTGYHLKVWELHPLILFLILSLLSLKPSESVIQSHCFLVPFSYLYIIV